VAPPTRTNPIPGWTEAIELKSAGVLHLAAQTRTRGPHGPLTTSLLRPTRGSKPKFGRRARRLPSAAPVPSDPAGALYVGAKAGLRPLHDALLGEIRALGTFDIAPKKGYLSLRRRKQFAMVQPSTTSRIDLGLILPATTPATSRLEPAATFNPLFTHRVRISAATDLDDELRGWLATAYALAG